MSKRAVMLALALAASGCGGHKKATAPPSQTPVAAETAAPTNPAAADCNRLITLRNQVEQALLAGKLDPSMPRSITPQARKAPAEIRPAALKIAGAYRQVRKELAEGQPPGQVLTHLSSMPGLTEATQRIDRWAAANC